MEKSLLIYKFSSGHYTVNGKYSLVNPLWFRGLLTVKLTEKRILITLLGVTIWEALFPDVLSVQIKPKILGVSVNVILLNKKGFLFMINDMGNLVEKLKELSLPVLYDNKLLQDEVNRFKIASHPTVLFVTAAIGVIFLIFIIYNILYGVAR